MTPALLATATLTTPVTDARSHVAAALARLAQAEPTLRAMVPEDDRAARLEAAVAELEERFPDPAARPRLYGVLIGVKDIVAVDGLPTRAGSALPPEAFAMPEATAVSRFRAAGAIVLGKTVTAEFASSTPNGTTNPHNPARTPGGSSSGSAAGVAAGYFPLAIGSQTGGSVIRPAAFCGVVGYKPSYDRLPIEGTVFHARSVDTLGLFTQDIAGMAVAASVVVDGWREVGPRTSPPVLGIPDGPYLQHVEPGALAVFEETLAGLRDRGVEVRRVPFMADHEHVDRRHSRLMIAEFGDAHAERFARWGALYSGQAATNVDLARSIGEAERRVGLEGRLEFRERVRTTLDREGLDAFACPSATGPAPETLAYTGNPVMNVPWSHGGVPAIGLPAGTLDGMPLGLQLVGRFGEDEALLALAAQIEALLP